MGIIFYNIRYYYDVMCCNFFWAWILQVEFFCNFKKMWYYVRMDAIQKRKMKLRDSDRYAFKMGILKLEDVCYFCGGSGCDATHHINYADPPKRARAHYRCHTIFHNKKRAKSSHTVIVSPSSVF